MLQCVAVCCSVLQCVAVCCSVVLAMFDARMPQVCCSVLQCVAVCRMLQHVVVYFATRTVCNVCVAACCGAL